MALALGEESLHHFRALGDVPGIARASDHARLSLEPRELETEELRQLSIKFAWRAPIEGHSHTVAEALTVGGLLARYLVQDLLVEVIQQPIELPRLQADVASEVLVELLMVGVPGERVSQHRGDLLDSFINRNGIVEVRVVHVHPDVAGVLVADAVKLEHEGQLRLAPRCVEGRPIRGGDASPMRVAWVVADSRSRIAFTFPFTPVIIAVPASTIDRATAPGKYRRCDPSGDSSSTRDANALAMRYARSVVQA